MTTHKDIQDELHLTRYRYDLLLAQLLKTGLLYHRVAKAEGEPSSCLKASYFSLDREKIRQFFPSLFHHLPQETSLGSVSSPPNSPNVDPAFNLYNILKNNNKPPCNPPWGEGLRPPEFLKIDPSMPLDEEVLQIARQAGIHESHIPAIFQQFKLHHADHPDTYTFSSWQAAWGGWVRKLVTDYGYVTKPRRPKTPLQRVRRARQVVSILHQAAEVLTAMEHQNPPPSPAPAPLESPNLEPNSVLNPSAESLPTFTPPQAKTMIRAAQQYNALQGLQPRSMIVDSYQVPEEIQEFLTGKGRYELQNPGSRSLYRSELIPKEVRRRLLASFFEENKTYFTDSELVMIVQEFLAVRPHLKVPDLSLYMGLYLTKWRGQPRFVVVQAVKKLLQTCKFTPSPEEIHASTEEAQQEFSGISVLLDNHEAAEEAIEAEEERKKKLQEERNDPVKQAEAAEFFAEIYRSMGTRRDRS